MGRARVVHLTSSNERRGAEVYALEIAAERPGRRFEHSVHAMHWTCPEPGPRQAPVARLPRIQAGRAWLGLLVPGLGRNLARLLTLIHRVRPAVVVAHGGNTLRYAAAAARFARQPVYVLKNITLDSYWVRTREELRANQRRLPRFAATVFESETCRSDHRALYGSEGRHVAIISNARPVPAEAAPGLREAVRAELGTRADVLLLAWVGALVEEKHPQAAVQALGELVAGGIDARLVVVGSGPLAAALDQQARERGLASRVVGTGSRTDVTRLLAAPDALLLTSRVEGMPGAAIEAGLAGLAAVCFDVGAVSDVVVHEQTGFLVPAGDVGQMAARLRQLALNPGLRRELGRAARRRCVERFDVEDAARRWEDLFASLREAR